MAAGTDEELLEAIRRRLASTNVARMPLQDGTGVVVSFDGLKVLSLNETAEAGLEAVLAGAKTVPEVVTRLVSQFDVDPERAAEDVRLLVRRLAEQLGP